MEASGSLSGNRQAPDAGDLAPPILDDARILKDEVPLSARLLLYGPFVFIAGMYAVQLVYALVGGAVVDAPFIGITLLLQMLALLAAQINLLLMPVHLKHLSGRYRSTGWLGKTWIVILAVLAYLAISMAFAFLLAMISLAYT